MQSPPTPVPSHAINPGVNAHLISSHLHPLSLKQGYGKSSPSTLLLVYTPAKPLTGEAARPTLKPPRPGNTDVAIHPSLGPPLGGCKLLCHPLTLFPAKEQIVPFRWWLDIRVQVQRFSKAENMLFKKKKSFRPDQLVVKIEMVRDSV